MSFYSFYTIFFVPPYATLPYPTPPSHWEYLMRALIKGTSYGKGNN